MLMILMTWASLVFTIIFAPKKTLWATTTIQGFFMSFLSLVWIFSHNPNYHPLFLMDEISTPLSMLTCWLFPLTLMASQSKLRSEPMSYQRTYIANISLLQLLTLLTFTTSNLILFFIFFEATLIPTMIVITRWGSQKQRLQAGIYLTFYTLIGAVPLMIWLMKLYVTHNSLTYNLMWIQSPLLKNMNFPGLFWTLFNLAFLIKLPLYTTHLWLPKAHVEAPVAGSMVLAGTLLKLGGYGILRMSALSQEELYSKTLPLMTLTVLGTLTMALLCTRQTDLKMLIAMSSVSHMNLVLAAALVHTPQSYSGAMLMMIAHGLTSSALFCLANLSYERTKSRTLTLLRGSLIMFPHAGAWWLLITLFNMAFPPTISFYGELFMLCALSSWSTLTFLILTLNLILAMAYSLYLFWSTQRGPTVTHLKPTTPYRTRELTILTLHMLPGILLIFKPEMIFS